MIFIDEEKEMNQMSQHQIHNWIKPEKILRRQDSQNFLSNHWNSAVPKSYKRNVIIGDVHHAKRISCGFDYEISVIKSKYIRAQHDLNTMSYIKLQLRCYLFAVKLSNRVKFMFYINWKFREVHEEEWSNWQLAGITDRGINVFQFFWFTSIFSFFSFTK